MRLTLKLWKPMGQMKSSKISSISSIKISSKSELHKVRNIPLKFQASALYCGNTLTTLYLLFLFGCFPKSNHYILYLFTCVEACGTCRELGAHLSPARGDEAGQVAVCDHLSGGAGAVRSQPVCSSRRRAWVRPTHRHLQSEAARLCLLRPLLRLLGTQQTRQGTAESACLWVIKLYI